MAGHLDFLAMPDIHAKRTLPPKTVGFFAIEHFKSNSFAPADQIDHCMRPLHHPEEVQYKQYDSNNNQGVNPAAGLREAWADISAKKAQQP
jgi:hypothetical protein